EGETGVANAGAVVVFDVMANDVDPNMQAIWIGSFDSVSDRGGTITLSPGSGPDGRDQLVYTAPATGGRDTFSYTVTDGSLSATGTVVIDVKDGAGMRLPDNPA